MNGLMNLVFAVSLGALVSSTAYAEEWYSGGTLHSSTIGKWKEGSEQDRLATAADWTFAVIGQDKAVSHGFDGLRDMAEELVICVDTSVEGLDEVNGLASSEIAASCAILLGW